MTETYATNPSTPPHIASFTRLLSDMNAMAYCPEIDEAFYQDPISQNHHSLYSSVCAFLLQVTEGYVTNAGVSLRDIGEIYDCLHENVYGDFSTPLIRRLDLEELTRGNRTVPEPDRSFDEFLSRYPQLTPFRETLKKNIFKFLSDMTDLSLPPQELPIRNCCNGDNCTAAQEFYKVSTQIDDKTYTGVGYLDENGELQCIFPNLNGLIEVSEAPKGP